MEVTVFLRAMLLAREHNDTKMRWRIQQFSTLLTHIVLVHLTDCGQKFYDDLGW